MWYRTGTISLVQNSDTITGTGTNWITQHRGWILVSAASGALHEIKEIISSTEVRLAAPVTDASASELGYFIIPTHSLNADLITKINLMITEFETSRDAWQTVYQDISAGVYQLWIDQGNIGTVADFLAVLKGETGKSAYEDWVALPENAGSTFEQFIASLKGETGESAYEQWAALPANDGKTFQQFIDSLSGEAVTATAANVTAANDAQTASETARDLAQKWASEIEDTEVTPGLYSALHHAAKAATSATLAATHLSNVQLVKTAVETIFDNFDDRYLGSFTTDDEPEADNDGDPINIGAMYLNEDEGELHFWNGLNWKSPEATAEAAAAQALQAQAAAEAARDAAQLAEANAGQSANAAAQHANAASLSSNATSWVSGGAYVLDQQVWSLVNNEPYHCIVPHSGETVDPSVDTTHWAPSSGSSHTHAIADVTGLQAALAGKSAPGHSHGIEDVTGLQVALNSKATAAQGAKADTAVQPSALGAAATSNDFNDLDNKPTSGMNSIVASIIFGG
jgi:hypothetical protein